MHFLQIWIPPATRGLPPSYEQRLFPLDDRRGRLLLVVSPDGADGSITIHQDARLYTSLLAASDSVTHTIPPGRHAWVQIVSGEVAAGGDVLEEGAGLAVSDEAGVSLEAKTDAELLVFDLP